MKTLLKEVQFLLNNVQRTSYYYGSSWTDSYKLASRVDAALVRLEADEEINKEI